MPWGISIPVAGLETFAELLELQNKEAIAEGKEPKTAVLVQEPQSTYVNARLAGRAVAITFASVVESRDRLTGGHVKRSAEMVLAIGMEMSKDPRYADVLTADYLDNLAYAAPLHDIGKIVIPDAILNKPGRLTPEEFEIIKTHTIEGKRFIDQLNEDLHGTSRLSVASDIAYTHHEWWNGKGYPRGLSGEDIPLGGRIMAVADVYDALISKRPYKEAYPVSIAIEMIVKESGTHFDPAVVDAFLRIMS